MTSEFMIVSYESADTAIEELHRLTGVDYSSKREYLAKMYDDGLYDGYWDCQTQFDDLPNIRFIQEDHYDQQMHDDYKPKKGYLDYISTCHYLFLVDSLK